MKKDLIKFIVLVIILIGSFALFIKQETKSVPIKIAFLGDSITQYGWEQPNGYVNQVITGLTNAGMKILPIPAGKCGHTSLDMLNRMDKDVLSKNPDIMFFMGGLNDIWLNKGTFEEYQNNIKQIMDKAQAAGVRIVLMNLTIISEDINSTTNREIDKYNEFLQKLANERSILYIDLNSVMKDELKKHKTGEKNILTLDGVHLNDRGNSIIAQKIVQDFLANK